MIDELTPDSDAWVTALRFFSWALEWQNLLFFACAFALVSAPVGVIRILRDRNHQRGIEPTATTQLPNKAKLLSPLLAVISIAIGLFALKLAADSEDIIDDLAEVQAEVESELLHLTDLYIRETSRSLVDIYWAFDPRDNTNRASTIRRARISGADRYGTAQLAIELLLNEYRTSSQNLQRAAEDASEGTSENETRNTTVGPYNPPRRALIVFSDDESLNLASDRPSTTISDAVVASSLVQVDDDRYLPILLARIRATEASGANSEVPAEIELPNYTRDFLSLGWVKLLDFSLIGFAATATDNSGGDRGSEQSADQITNKLADDLVEITGDIPTSIKGDDRYETALKVAAVYLRRSGQHTHADLCGLSDKSTVGKSTVFLASGEDKHVGAALIAAPVAAIGRNPILLWPHERDSMMRDKIMEYLVDKSVKRVVILGSEDAIDLDADFEGWQNTNGNELKRIEGSDRYATSVMFARAALGMPDPESDSLDLPRQSERDPCLRTRTLAFANGNYPLTGAIAVPLMAKEQAPLLLVEEDTVPESVRSFLCDLNDNHDVANVWILGGARRISDKVADEIIYLLGGEVDSANDYGFKACERS